MDKLKINTYIRAYILPPNNDVNLPQNYQTQLNSIYTELTKRNFHKNTFNNYLIKIFNTSLMEAPKDECYDPRLYKKKWYPLAKLWNMISGLEVYIDQNKTQHIRNNNLTHDDYIKPFKYHLITRLLILSDYKIILPNSIITLDKIIEEKLDEITNRNELNQIIESLINYRALMDNPSEAQCTIIQNYLNNLEQVDYKIIQIIKTNRNVSDLVKTMGPLMNTLLELQFNKLLSKLEFDSKCSNIVLKKLLESVGLQIRKAKDSQVVREDILNEVYKTIEESDKLKLDCKKDCPEYNPSHGKSTDGSTNVPSTSNTSVDNLDNNKKETDTTNKTDQDKIQLPIDFFKGTDKELTEKVCSNLPETDRNMAHLIDRIKKISPKLKGAVNEFNLIFKEIIRIHKILRECAVSTKVNLLKVSAHYKLQFYHTLNTIDIMLFKKNQTGSINDLVNVLIKINHNLIRLFGLTNSELELIYSSKILLFSKNTLNDQSNFTQPVNKLIEKLHKESHFKNKYKKYKLKYIDLRSQPL